MKFSATDKITILGMSGCGKSTLARKINAMWPRAILIDPMREQKDGFIFSDFSDFSKKMVELKKEKATHFKAVFQFDPDKDNHDVVFNEILRVGFHFKNVQIYVDEVHLFSSPHFLPHYLKNNLFMGRHQGVSLMCVSQRPGSVHKSILSQSQHVFAGCMHEKNDLAYISNFLGCEAKNLADLKRGEFYYFSPGKNIQKIQT